MIGAGPPECDMPLSAVTTTHRKPRRRASASGDDPIECDVEENTAQIAAGRAQISPEKRPSAKGARISAAGSDSDSYKRLGPDMPSADW